MRTVICVLFLIAGFISQPVLADETAEKNIKQAIKKLMPDADIVRIQPSPVADLYEVLIGADVIYMSPDGRFALNGDLLDLNNRENLTETQRAFMRKGILSRLPKKEFIEFAPASTKYVIYVFTDVDCSYCRRLHKDVPELNDNGVAVRYLAFPRGGEGSHAFNVMQSVWCADNPKQAITDAKNGKRVKPKQCLNPVEKQYLMGQKFGIRGTPAIYLENGQGLPGYVPPDQLLELVGR